MRIPTKARKRKEDGNMANNPTGKRTPGPAELSAFCAQVALMMGSGMALYDGMETLAATAKGSPEEALYVSVSEGVTQTGSLYEALKRDGNWPAYLVEMTAIGERTGSLEEVMNGLAEYYERESRIRRAIVSAVTYPVVLGVMMLAVVLVMILMVLPVFRRVLGSMGVAMSASGEVMMNAGTTIGWVVLALVSLTVLAVVVCVVLMRTGKRAQTLAFLKSVFPPVHRLSGRLASSRVASVLSMMLSGGFPMEEALDMIPAVLPDEEAAAEVAALRERMGEGESFADAISQAKLFDPLHSRMIRMGVEAGREDQVMARIAVTYEEEVEEGIAGLVSIIEPTLVALLSVVIGAVLLSVMLPMASIIASMV